MNHEVLLSTAIEVPWVVVVVSSDFQVPVHHGPSVKVVHRIIYVYIFTSFITPKLNPILSEDLNIENGFPNLNLMVNIFFEGCWIAWFIWSSSSSQTSNTGVHLKTLHFSILLYNSFCIVINLSLHYVCMYCCSSDLELRGNQIGRILEVIEQQIRRLQAV
jgi:hypothetical protein